MSAIPRVTAKVLRNHKAIIPLDDQGLRPQCRAPRGSDDNMRGFVEGSRDCFEKALRAALEGANLLRVPAVFCENLRLPKRFVF